MKFWKSPDNDYDWCNMPKSLSSPVPSSEEENAIATLVYDCGVNAKMIYCFSKCQSFALPIGAKSALVNDFGYSDDADIDRRKYYTKKKWIAKLKKDLNNSYPLIYFGVDTRSVNFFKGHAFIIDGYNSDDKFHINWGWGGNHDKYYEIMKLTPDSNNFSEYQQAIFNLHPENPSTINCIDCNSVFVVRQYYKYSPYGFPDFLYYYPVAGTIIAGDKNEPITIDSGETVHYKVYNRIELLPGFETKAGADFTAEIIQCPNDTYKSLIIPSDNNSENNKLINITEKENNNINELNISIYPNPNKGQFTAVISNYNNENIFLSITNILGTTIYSQTNINSSEIPINISEQPAGIYFIQAIAGNKIFKGKIIVQ